MLQSVFIPTFEGVLLAAMEFNREVEKVSVEKTERKPLNAIHCAELFESKVSKHLVCTVHCADEEGEGEMATNEELGTKKIGQNVEAAWTNRSKSAVGKEQTYCVSWYRIFCFLGG